MAQRICVICGASFGTPPSNNKRTCSSECSSVLRSRSHKGVRNVWSAESRQRLREKPTPPQLAKGMPAAMSLPESQRGEQHRDALVWHLIDPGGNHVTVVNLNEWARINLRLFGETDERGAIRIAAGFRQIALSMAGKTKRNVYRYKGWQLAEPPTAKK